MAINTKLNGILKARNLRILAILFLLLSMIGIIFFNTYYWTQLKFSLFGPSTYIVYNIHDKQIERMHKDGATEVLWRDSTMLDVSNSVEVDGKLLFIVNYIDAAQLVVFDMGSNMIIRKIPLVGVKGVSTEQLYLMGNNLQINYRCIYMKDYEFGKGQYNLQYYVPVENILDETIDDIKPIHYDGIEKHPPRTKFKGSPRVPFSDTVYKETNSQGKKEVLFQNNDLTIEYEEYGARVYEDNVVGTLKKGEYVLNSWQIQKHESDFWGFNTVYRFQGVYSNQFVLFKVYDEYFDLKHTNVYKQSDSMVYANNNLFFKKIYLPRAIFEPYEILYIGR